MDEIKQEMRAIRESQIRMEADLSYHIKRTDLLEARVEKHEERVAVALQPMPLKDKLQIGAFIAAIVSGITAFTKYIGL